MNMTRRADKGLGKTAAGGSGGSFAAHERSPAPPPAHPADEVSVAELDAAVNFGERDQKIRDLWNGGPKDREVAETLSAELVRDSLAWRYPGATELLISESDGENRFIAELRDKNGGVVAWDPTMGGLEDDAVDYSNAHYLDDELSDRLWAHVDGMPRTGVLAPQRLRSGDLKGVGEGMEDEAYRFGIHSGPSSEQVTEALDVQDEDYERAIDKLSIELSNDQDPRVAGLTSVEAVRKHMMSHTKDFYQEVSAEAARVSYVSSVARIHALGLPHPCDEKMDQDWGNTDVSSDGTPRNPWSKPYQEHAIREAQSLREQLEAKQITPSKLIGTGYRNPRKLAFEYLDRREAEAKKALETEGRNLVASRFSMRRLREAHDMLSAQYGPE